MNDRRLDRRSVLKGVAAMAAAPLFVPATLLGTSGRPGANDLVSLGFIGLGGRGSSLAQSFLGTTGSRCVAFADCFKSRREKWAGPGRKVYSDLRDLVADRDVDAVVIATPDHWHVPAGLLAIRAGKDVYVEKPIGHCVHNGQVMRQEVRARKKIFQYGTQRRSMAHYRLGCELVRNGRIGKVRTIDIATPNGMEGGSLKEIPVPPDFDYDLWLGPAPLAPYTKDRCTCLGAYFIYDYSIGHMAGNGAHNLDLVVWGYDLRKAGTVEVRGKGVVPVDCLFNAVHSWNVRYEFAGGPAMNFIPGGFLVQFTGTEGWVRISDQGRLETEPKELSQADPGTLPVRLPVSGHHAQNFVDCVKSRKDPVSTVEDAVTSDILSHLGDIAVRTQRKITWNWEKEEIAGDPEASGMLKRPLRDPWTL
jgi:glucose-fructose oxidoreductase